MFINPAEAVKNGWIKGLVDPTKQIQPNAIDFTLDKLLLVSGSHASLSEENKTMRQLLEVPSAEQMEHITHWYLRRGQVYDGTSDVYIEVPEGCAAILYTRSTLARNGVFLVSGLYDSGYKGHIGFTIYPFGGDIEIKPGTRVGQIALVTADSAKLYAGGYNHDAGTHYKQDGPGNAITGQQTKPENDFVFVDAPIAAGKQTVQGADAGQRQIASDPRRTEPGMGPLLGGNSSFI